MCNFIEKLDMYVDYYSRSDVEALKPLLNSYQLERRNGLNLRTTEIFALKQVIHSKSKEQGVIL